MKNALSDKLVLLATAQEYMLNIADIIEQLDQSQIAIEKVAYDSMNISDKILNLSKESSQVIEKLQENLQSCKKCAEREAAQKTIELLQETQILLQHVLANALQCNEASHLIEEEAAYQREIEDKLKCTLGEIKDGIDSAAACAEMLLSEM